MRLLDRLRGSTAERAFSEAAASGAAMWFSYGAPDSERVQHQYGAYARDGYQGNGIVFAVVGARINLFSEAEFKFQGLRDRKLIGTPALELLENPWPNGTTGELLARMEQDVSLAGNAFIRTLGDRLERLRPDWVSIVSVVHEDGDGRRYREVVGYVYQPVGDADMGEPQIIPAGEMCHWSPIPDPLANWRGMSWLTPVVREIEADTAMTRHKSKFFDNAATPNLALKYKKSFAGPGGQKLLEALQERFDLRHAGPENSSRTVVLDEGADLTVIGNTFEQMSFATVQAAGENRITAAAGVPGIVVGLKEGLMAATYSNYGQAMKRFETLWARPQWRSACGALRTIIDVPTGTRLWYDPANIAALWDEEEVRARIFGVKAQTAGTLIRSGYDPATVAPAVDANDLSLLTHTGSIPVTLYPDGEPPAGAARPASPPGVPA